MTTKPRRATKLPTRYDPGMADMAFKMFLDGKDAAFIQQVCSLDRITYNRLRRAGEWNARKRDLLAAQFASSADRFRAIQEENILKVAQRHLDLTESLETHIGTQLEKKTLKPRALNELSRALANSADVSGRVVGLNKLAEQPMQKSMSIQFGLQVKIVNDPTGSTEKSVTIETTAVSSPVPEPVAAAESNQSVWTLPEPEPF